MHFGAKMVPFERFKGTNKFLRRQCLIFSHVKTLTEVCHFAVWARRKERDNQTCAGIGVCEEAAESSALFAVRARRSITSERAFTLKSSPAWRGSKVSVLVASSSSHRRCVLEAGIVNGRSLSEALIATRKSSSRTRAPRESGSLISSPLKNTMIERAYHVPQSSSSITEASLRSHSISPAVEVPARAPSLQKKRRLRKTG